MLLCGHHSGAWLSWQPAAPHSPIKGLIVLCNMQNGNLNGNQNTGSQNGNAMAMATPWEATAMSMATTMAAATMAT